LVWFQTTPETRHTAALGKPTKTFQNAMLNLKPTFSRRTLLKAASAERHAKLASISTTMWRLLTQRTLARVILQSSMSSTIASRTEIRYLPRKERLSESFALESWSVSSTSFLFGTSSRRLASTIRSGT
jgi:hypothetical protein